MKIKKCIAMLLVLVMMLSLLSTTVFAVASENTVQRDGVGKVLARRELKEKDLVVLIGEVDEEATVTTSIRVGSNLPTYETRGLHVPNIVSVALTPGKKGFAVTVSNFGIDSLTSLHLTLTLTDYNGKYIDSYTIDDYNISVGSTSYVWMKSKSGTIKENISLSGYAIDGPTYDLGPISTYRYNFAGGAYGKLSSYEGQRHHIPSNSVNGLSTSSGPAIRMLTEDHKLTSSYGSSTAAVQFRAKEKKLIKEGKFAEAMQMGIDDIRDLFGSKYDDAIAEMISYAVSSGYIKSGSVK